MSVGFGFSAGDFIAALQLVSTVSSALQSSSTASTEFRSLIAQLHTLESALLRVKRLEIHESQHGEVIALRQAASQCQGTIDAFWEKCRKYQPSLAGTGSGSSVRDGWRKIKWAVCKKEDVVRFKADLMAHTESIELLLTTVQMAATSISEKKNDESQRSLAGRMQDSYFGCMQRMTVILERVSTGIQQGKQLLEMTAKVIQTNVQIFQAVLNIQKIITRIPGQVDREQPVYFIDALGRETPFYLEFITSASSLTFVLQNNFRNIGTGATKIEKGEFAIQDSTTKRDVDLDSPWEVCFCPGQKVAMSMVFNSVKDMNMCCPKCREENGDNFAEDEDIECMKCMMVYRRSISWTSPQPLPSFPMTRAQITPMETEEMDTVREKKEIAKEKRKKPHDEEEEMALFRRVRIKTSIVLPTEDSRPNSPAFVDETRLEHEASDINPQLKRRSTYQEELSSGGENERKFRFRKRRNRFRGPSGEEDLDTAVKRIKTRVAELTGNAPSKTSLGNPRGLNEDASHLAGPAVAADSRPVNLPPNMRNSVKLSHNEETLNMLQLEAGLVPLSSESSDSEDYDSDIESVSSDEEMKSSDIDTDDNDPQYYFRRERRPVTEQEHAALETLIDDGSASSRIYNSFDHYGSIQEAKGAAESTSQPKGWNAIAEDFGQGEEMTKAAAMLSQEMQAKNDSVRRFRRETDNTLRVDSARHGEDHTGPRVRKHRAPRIMVPGEVLAPYELDYESYGSESDISESDDELTREEILDGSSRSNLLQQKPISPRAWNEDEMSGVWIPDLENLTAPRDPTFRMTKRQRAVLEEDSEDEKSGRPSSESDEGKSILRIRRLEAKRRRILKDSKTHLSKNPWIQRSNQREQPRSGPVTNDDLTSKAQHSIKNRKFRSPQISSSISPPNEHSPHSPSPRPRIISTSAPSNDTYHENDNCILNSTTHPAPQHNPNEHSYNYDTSLPSIDRTPRRVPDRPPRWVPDVYRSTLNDNLQGSTSNNSTSSKPSKMKSLPVIVSPVVNHTSSRSLVLGWMAGSYAEEEKNEEADAESDKEEYRAPGSFFGTAIDHHL